jgi:hypothetical protein
MKLSFRESLQKLMRSRRLRAFFITSLVLHAVFGLTLVFSIRVRYAVFGNPNAKLELRETPLTDGMIEQSIKTLTDLYRARFIETIAELTEMRSELNRLQLEKLKTLRDQDEDRQKKIANKMWPSAQQPDPKAVFVPRIDVDPPPVKLLEVPARMEDMSLADLYNLHPVLEQDAGRLYERAHAITLCEPIEDVVPLSQTLKVTELKIPPRRPINTAVLDTRSISAAVAGSLDAFRNELVAATLEAQDIVANVRRWQSLVTDTAVNTTSQFGPSLSVMPIETEYYGQFLNPLSLKRVSRAQVINPPVELGGSIGPVNDVLPAEWVSVCRWYVVGPFTHPGAKRRLDDLERKFPPEGGVDLDAVYEGKGGRPLKWKYRVFGADFLDNGIRMEPYLVDNSDFAIWYFYTEIRSSKEQDVLASFASDDYGVCWLNKKRVYQSPPETQPWRPFCLHNFRVLHLKKGINNILFKLENAQGTTAFSVLLMTYEDRDLIDAIKARFNI